MKLIISNINWRYFIYNFGNFARFKFRIKALFRPGRPLLPLFSFKVESGAYQWTLDNYFRVPFQPVPARLNDYIRLFSLLNIYLLQLDQNTRVQATQFLERASQENLVTSQIIN